MCTVKIGNKTVGDGHPCFVVAEIGINHNGSLEIAKRLIEAAVEAGCDAVKFQKRTVQRVYTSEQLSQPRKVDISIIENAMKRMDIEDVRYWVFPEENYNRLKNDPTITTNGDLKFALEFGMKEFDIIDIYCREMDIMWFASSWDGLSAHFVNGFNVPCHKIASACLTHANLLQRVRSNGKPVILSTGGSTIEQIERAVQLLGKEDLIILHCVANYPCKDREINLSIIETLQRKFAGIPIGYSGHEIDIMPSIMAVTLGACMIERHITLNRKMPGTDHQASLEPQELEDMVSYIRQSELVRGDGIKRVYDSELQVMKKLRRKQDF
ncbi:MAG: N-acetylneuraminate synthase family protein [Patescibacteria group bacterium]